MRIWEGAPGDGTPGGAGSVQQIGGISELSDCIATTFGFKPKDDYLIENDLISLNAICNSIYEHAPEFTDHRAGLIDINEFRLELESYIIQVRRRAV